MVIQKVKSTTPTTPPLLPTPTPTLLSTPTVPPTSTFSPNASTTNYLVLIDIIYVIIIIVIYIVCILLLGSLFFLFFVLVCDAFLVGIVRIGFGRFEVVIGNYIINYYYLLSILIICH